MFIRCVGEGGDGQTNAFGSTPMSSHCPTRSPQMLPEAQPMCVGILGFPVITDHPLSINQSHLLTGLLVKASCFN